jgi:hypothetical protein
MAGKGNVLTAIRAAESVIGAPYVYGAEGPRSFDCSGLMVWSWAKAGIHLPRTSQAMAKFGSAVTPDKIRPGDLVTSNWGQGPASHVAMYIGAGRVINAPRPGRTVTIAKLDKDYRAHVDAIRRIPGTSTAGISEADLKVPGLDGVWDWTKGWSDKLLDGDPLGALGDLTKSAGELQKLVMAPLVTIADAVMNVGKVAELFLKLALPSTWVRIACAIGGTAILGLGLFFLVREARAGGA